MLETHRYLQKSPAVCRERAAGQRGSAMVAMLLVMAVLTGLGAMIFNVGAANLANSARDRVAGGAMGAAEAGVAHAMAYMRTYGVGQMTCDGPNPASALCSNPWGFNHPSPGAGGQTVFLNGGRMYKAWVQRIQSYSPGANAPVGRFRIHSFGTGGPAGGARSVSVDVAVKPFAFPLGLFGRDYVRAAGSNSVSKESLFSAGCIGKRDRLSFDTTSADLAHPELIPGAHSARYISTSVINSESDPDCDPQERRNIHRPKTYNPPGEGFCNSSYRFDRDLQGGPLTATSCDILNGGRLPTPPGSYFDAASLGTYGYSDPRGLPANQYAFLRGVAQEQGNFYDCTSTPRSPACNAAGELNSMTTLNGGMRPNAVLYVKMDPGKKVHMGPTELTGYQEPYCGQRSVLIVIEGGDLRLNSNLDFVGAVFVPDGTADVLGGAQIVGTMFAKQLVLGGGVGNAGARFTLKGQCFFDNLPGGVLSVVPSGFAELDR